MSDIVFSKPPLSCIFSTLQEREGTQKCHGILEFLIDLWDVFFFFVHKMYYLNSGYNYQDQRAHIEL